MYGDGMVADEIKIYARRNQYRSILIKAAMGLVRGMRTFNVPAAACRYLAYSIDYLSETTSHL